jgi:mycothiol synthase
MKPRCSLKPSPSPTGQTWSEALEILKRADVEAGAAVVSDQALLEARTGQRQLNLVYSDDESAIMGLVIVGEGEFDLIIDPPRRGQGMGSCALNAVLTRTPGPLATWVHGVNPAAVALLEGANFQPARTLIKMATSIAEIASQERTIALPAGYSVRTFTGSDAHAWVALNARVFAEHPEQGSLTETDLAARTQEPWFDAENFLLVHDSEGALKAYCWLKVEDGEGEIYVIGVAPEEAGKGLGAALFDLALQRLVQLANTSDAVRMVSLYVDADNERAVRLYRSRGLSDVLTSSQWIFNRP